MRKATCPLSPSDAIVKREIAELKEQMEHYRLKSPTQQAVEQAKARLAYQNHLEKNKDPQRSIREKSRNVKKTLI